MLQARLVIPCDHNVSVSRSIDQLVPVYFSEEKRSDGLSPCFMDSSFNRDTELLIQHQQNRTIDGWMDDDDDDVKDKMADNPERLLLH